jgi:dTDP-4-amino-4,6-dideoxygalactose transaminase
MDIFNRTATLTIGPKFTQNDMNDVVAALKKVHAALLT